MNNNLKLIIAAVAIIGGLSLLYFSMQKKADTPPPTTERQTKEIYNFDTSVCPGKTIEFTIADPYMRGVVEKGQRVSIAINYYACNDLKKGDVVLYRYSQYEDPVVRRVVGAPGDSFKLESVKGQGWELFINGKAVKGVKGQSYYFGVSEHKPPLELAAQSRQGKLPTGELILLASFPPGDRDSGTFGLANQKDIVGKVEIDATLEEAKGELQ